MAVLEGQDERGRFVKGNKFGSKSKRRDKFMTEVRERTNNLLDLLNVYLEIINDLDTPVHVKARMIEWLFEGEIGKATQFIDQTTRHEDPAEEALKKVEDREKNGDNG